MTDSPGFFSQSVFEQPPNIAAIRSAFPMIKDRKGLLFAYSDRIYNPDRVKISPWLIAHEMRHCKQQWDVGGPEIWWGLYLKDPVFRLRQEVEACKVEYQTFLEVQPPPNRLARARHMDTIVERLSSGVYGYMCRRKEAKAIMSKLFA